MKLKTCWTVGTTCAGVLAIAGGAQAIMIDDFDIGPGMVDSDLSPGPTNFAAVGSAIGGSRTLEILGFPGDGNPTSEGAELEVSVPPGQLGHSQDAFAPGGRSKVTWDANGGGLGGEDLTDGGLANGIMVDLISIDVGMVDVTLMVEDTVGGASSLVLSPLAAGPNSFFFADFIGDADFSDADVIMLQIDAEATSDLVLDLLETIDVPPPPGPREGIPEPISSTLALMGLSTLAVATKRRRVG